MDRRDFLNLVSSAALGTTVAATGMVAAEVARNVSAVIPDEAMLEWLNNFCRGCDDHIACRMVTRHLGQEFEKAIGLPMTTLAGFDPEKQYVCRTISPRFVTDVDYGIAETFSSPRSALMCNCNVTDTIPSSTRGNVARTLLDTARVIIADVSDDVRHLNVDAILDASIYIKREAFTVEIFGWCTYVKNK